MKGTLKTAEDFRLARKGKKVHSTHFMAFVSASGPEGVTIITPKAVGTAVARNTVRRVAREAHRAADVKGTVLLHAKATAGEVSKAELAQDLEHLFRKASRL